MFPTRIPKKTAKLIEMFQQQHPVFLSDFYLSGGTALALQLGHRESEDLDFFRQNNFEPSILQHQLLQFGNLDDTELSQGTVNTFLNGVKLQFLHYPYDLIKPTFQWSGLVISSLEDIACTKLQTIGMRGSKKDFIDIYFLLKDYSLTNLFELMDQKFKQVDYSKTHILKSLIYFEDAEQQPMPRMYQHLSWKEVKQKMIETIKSYSF